MINKKIINRAIFEMICYNCYKNNKEILSNGKMGRI